MSVKVAELEIRAIRVSDRDAIARIDAINTGQPKPEHWERSLTPFVGSKNGSPGLGFVAVSGDRVAGYLLGEVRAWEFGSPPCGWIYAVGVDPEFKRQGIALGLCREACSRFKEKNISHVRTMVRNDNLDVLSFFRASGFRAGPFIELELSLDEIK